MRQRKSTQKLPNSTLKDMQVRLIKLIKNQEPSRMPETDRMFRKLIYLPIEMLAKRKEDKMAAQIAPRVQTETPLQSIKRRKIKRKRRRHLISRRIKQREARAAREEGKILAAVQHLNLKTQAVPQVKVQEAIHLKQRNIDTERRTNHTRVKINTRISKSQILNQNQRSLLRRRSSSQGKILIIS